MAPPGTMVHPADENKEVLGEADVVIITGSTLVRNIRRGHWIRKECPYSGFVWHKCPVDT